MDQILKGPNANIITKSIQTTIFLKNNCKCKNPSEVLDYQHIAIISISIYTSIIFSFSSVLYGFWANATFIKAKRSAALPFSSISIYFLAIFSSVFLSLL